MIVAVALAIGVRRLLSRENIYTIKLVGRGHFVPKALHANMFLVRQARDVMDKDVTSSPPTLISMRSSASTARSMDCATWWSRAATTSPASCGSTPACGAASKKSYSGVCLGDVVQENFTIVREGDIMFDVVQRITRRDAVMAIVVKNGSRGRPADVVGIISKDQIANSVGASIKPFG